MLKVLIKVKVLLLVGNHSGKCRYLHLLGGYTCPPAAPPGERFGVYSPLPKTELCYSSGERWECFET